ncbi:hypothetical protein MRX96_039265 [Rhipicephalus microplus]
MTKGDGMTQELAVAPFRLGGSVCCRKCYVVDLTVLLAPLRRTIASGRLAFRDYYPDKNFNYNQHHDNYNYHEDYYPDKNFNYNQHHDNYNYHEDYYPDKNFNSNQHYDN